MSVDDGRIPAWRVDAMNRAVTLVGRNFNRARLYDKIAERAGVDMEKHLLYLLSRTAEAQPVRLAELAVDMELDRTSVSRSMQGLTSRGLVRRRPDPDDARALLFGVTEEGEQLLDRMWQAWNSVLADILEGWELEDKRRFLSLLQRFAFALDRFVGDG
jgi:DNA-binding MarR family transcriptional regulator